MIRKYRGYVIFFIILFIVLGLSGCTNKIVDTVPKVVTPENKKIPIAGKWKIEKCLNNDRENEPNTSQDKLVGQYAQFAKDSVLVGDFWGKDPSYKIRKVSVTDYFTYKLRFSQSNLGINSESIYVVTVTSGDKYLYEFAEISNNKLVASLKDNIYLLSKESTTVDNALNNKVMANSENEQTVSKKDQKLRSGLLLGIKNVSSSGEYTYRTLWIESIDKNIQPILETKDIFLPRKSGFSKVLSTNINTSKTKENIIVVDGSNGTSKGNVTKYNIDSENWKNKEGKIAKNILYVGNDYISMEVSGSGTIKGTSSTWQTDRFILKPLDNIALTKGVKISDFYGSSGLSSITDARNNAINTLGQDGITPLDNNIVEEDYGIFRKAGHWTLRGRLNYEQNGEYSNNDYNINLIPSPKVIFFDNLYVPWTNVKDKIPDATDVFTSPNKDIAIILTANKLYIYSMDKGKLSSEPLKKITLEPGDTPVMDEWALGSYVESWDKTFVKNQTTELKD